MSVADWIQDEMKNIYGDSNHLLFIYGTSKDLVSRTLLYQINGLTCSE